MKLISPLTRLHVVCPYSMLNYLLERHKIGIHMKTSILCAIFFLTLCLNNSLYQTKDQEKIQPIEELRKLIKRLGDDVLKVREEAQEQVKKLIKEQAKAKGEVKELVEEIKKAMKTRELEVEQRLVKKIVSKKDSYNIESSPCQKI